LLTTEENNRKPAKRPEMLKILCILTFIGSGLAIFSYLLTFLLFDEMKIIMEELNDQYPGIEEIFSGGKRFFLTGFILYSISLAGARQMWNMRKIGFHLYTVAQIFLLILPVIMIESYQLPLLGVLLSSVFVLGYYSNLKFMN
jgi:hypothetical protein